MFEPDGLIINCERWEDYWKSLYVGHMKESRTSAKNSAARANLQEKLKKLVDAKVFLRSAFFTDVLAEAKKFSLLTQEKNVNVIKLTKSNYERLLKKIQDSNDNILTLPNFKIIIDAVNQLRTKTVNLFARGISL